jgi:hypothetical protein
METLPERINVIRSITYDIPSLVIELEDMGIDKEEIDLEFILEHIHDWVYEDMSAPVSRHDLVYQDEDGNEL